MAAEVKWLALLAVLVTPTAAIFTDRCWGSVTSWIATTFWSGLCNSGSGLSSEDPFTITTSFPTSAVQNVPKTFYVTVNSNEMANIPVNVGFFLDDGFSERQQKPRCIGPGITTVNFRRSFTSDVGPHNATIQAYTLANEELYWCDQTTTDYKSIIKQELDIEERPFKITVTAPTSVDYGGKATVNVEINNLVSKDVAVVVAVTFSKVGSSKTYPANCPSTTCVEAGLTKTVSFSATFTQEGLMSTSVVVSTSTDTSVCTGPDISTTTYETDDDVFTRVKPQLPFDDFQCPAS